MMDGTSSIADLRKRKEAPTPGQLRATSHAPSATTSPNTVAAEEACGPPAKRRRPASRTPAKADTGTGESGSSAPWPQAFRELARTHRALNIVYTFCRAQKHFATTLDKIKGAVAANNRGKELTIEDVARVKAIVPRAVRFEHVEDDDAWFGRQDVQDTTTTTTAKKQRVKKFDTWEDMNLQKVEDGAAREDVLVFEFLDGDLTRGSKGKKFGDARNDSLRVPHYTHKQMISLIDKRNKRFSDAVVAFLSNCSKRGFDPVSQLEKEKDPHMPVPLDKPGETLLTKEPERIPEERRPIPDIINELKGLDWYANQIVPGGHRVFDPHPAEYGDLTFSLSPNLVNALYNARGITQFYTHQAEAINRLNSGHNVIVSTSTSSGKSLIYQAPMLHALEHDPSARGMFIFPTKALAQDQRRAMRELLAYLPGGEDVLVETFDGDTPVEHRCVIRDHARIIFTNPDMLHMAILPNENGWHSFLKHLRFVILDELHVYNGLFGAHIALVMRRLRRLCASVGNDGVQFVSCSATVANPIEHMQTIFGVRDVMLTDIDGSPRGRKEFLCWNTPFQVPGDATSGRGSSFIEAARLFAHLVLNGVRVIAFCRVKKQCEVLLSHVRGLFHRLGRSEASKLVMGYRGGYSPQDRRQIEKEMFDGKLLGIVATSALELGVDIGSLDAVISHGFPWSISNLRQQSGRAGRRNKDSLSILVGDSYALDQHYMRNPDEVFSKPNCALHVDLTDEMILEGHVQCAAFELPVVPDLDETYFGPQIHDIAATRLVRDEKGFYHCHPRFRPWPSSHLSIREIDSATYAVVDTTDNRNVIIEEIEETNVFFFIYEGGIFLHQGLSYLVEEFDIGRRLARVRRVNVDWTTKQRDFTDVDPIETDCRRKLGGRSSCYAFYGTMHIRTLVFGYFKFDRAGRIIEAVELNNPPLDRMSKGLWFDVPRSALEILRSRNMNAAAAIHAAEHAILSLLPSFVVSTPGDVRTECKNAAKELGAQHNRPHAAQRQKTPPTRQRPARLVFYDTRGSKSSSSGIACKAFEFADRLLERALARIDGCECLSAPGCVECVASERCNEMNVVLSKAGASVVLRCLQGLEDQIDVDSLPWGSAGSSEVVEGNHQRKNKVTDELASGLETIVAPRTIGGGRDV